MIHVYTYIDMSTTQPLSVSMLTISFLGQPTSEVENSSYGGTICAERTAISTASHLGFRSIELLAVSTVQSLDGELSDRSPCGICRQVIKEFSTPRTLILIDTAEELFILFILEFDLLLQIFSLLSLVFNVSFDLTNLLVVLILRVDLFLSQKSEIVFQLDDLSLQIVYALLVLFQLVDLVL